MPNGGPDCCGNCSHNKAVQEIAHPQPWAEFNSYCTLRKVGIKDAFWTYCNNFEYGKSPENRQLSVKPIGPITSSGLYEGYVRIPWLGDIAPSVIGDNDDDAAFGDAYSKDAAVDDSILLISISVSLLYSEGVSKLKGCM